MTPHSMLVLVAIMQLCAVIAVLWIYDVLLECHASTRWSMARYGISFAWICAQLWRWSTYLIESTPTPAGLCFYESHGSSGMHSIRAPLQYYQLLLGLCTATVAIVFAGDGLGMGASVSTAFVPIRDMACESHAFMHQRLVVALLGLVLLHGFEWRIIQGMIDDEKHAICQRLASEPV